MTNRRGLQLLAAGVACLIGLFGLASALAWHNATATPADEVSRAVLNDTGLDVRFGKAASFALWPRPRIRIEGIELLSETGERLVVAGSAEAQLAILPLLAGKAQVDEIRLRDVTATVPAASFAEWLQMLNRAADLPHAHARKIRILNGTFRREGSDKPFTGVTATITTPDAATPFMLAGSAMWNGEQLTFSGAMPAARQFAGGDASAWLALQTRLGRIDLTGSMAEPNSPRFTGDIQASSPSLRGLAEWSGLSAPFVEDIGPLKLSSQVAWSARRASFDETQLDLNGQRFEGALALALDAPRPALSGTLATSDTVDLTPFFPDLAKLRQDGDWSGRTFRWRSFGDADLDLRLSATGARAWRLVFDQAAIAIFLKNGRLEATLGRAGLGRGTVKAKLVLQPREDDIDAKLQASLEGVQPELMLAALGRPAGISGSLQGQLLLEATGSTPAELAATLQGRVSGMLRGGELSFVDLVDTLRGVDRNNPIAQFTWHSGRTEFDQLTFSTIVSDGFARIAEAVLTSPALRASATGELAMKSGQLNGRAVLGSAAANAKPPIIVEIGGPVDAPAVRPDMRSLIERLRPAPGQPG